MGFPRGFAPYVVIPSEPSIRTVLRPLWTKGAAMVNQGSLTTPRSARHQPVDDVIELIEVAALLDQVAMRSVALHLAVAEAPGVLAFRIEPDELLGAAFDFAQAPVVRQVVVVAPVAQHNHRGLHVDRADVVLHE